MIDAKEQRCSLTLRQIANGAKHRRQTSLVVQPGHHVITRIAEFLCQRHFPPSSPPTAKIGIAGYRQQLSQRGACLDARCPGKQPHEGLRNQVFGRAAVAGEAPGEPEDGRGMPAV